MRKKAAEPVEEIVEAVVEEMVDEKLAEAKPAAPSHHGEDAQRRANKMRHSERVHGGHR